MSEQSDVFWTLEVCTVLNVICNIGSLSTAATWIDVVQYIPLSSLLPWSSNAFPNLVNKSRSLLILYHFPMGNSRHFSVSFSLRVLAIYFKALLLGKYDLLAMISFNVFYFLVSIVFVYSSAIDLINDLQLGCWFGFLGNFPPYFMQNFELWQNSQIHTSLNNWPNFLSALPTKT